jgi:hypothetical protein
LPEQRELGGTAERLSSRGLAAGGRHSRTPWGRRDRRRIFDPWETHIDQPTRIIEIGETVVAEVTFTGKPTAKTDEVRFDAVDVFDLQDRLIVTMSNWYDLTYVREMLR